MYINSSTDCKLRIWSTECYDLNINKYKLNIMCECVMSILCVWHSYSKKTKSYSFWLCYRGNKRCVCVSPTHLWESSSHSCGLQHFTALLTCQQELPLHYLQHTHRHTHLHKSLNPIINETTEVVGDVKRPHSEQGDSSTRSEMTVRFQTFVHEEGVSVEGRYTWST